LFVRASACRKLARSCSVSLNCLCAMLYIMRLLSDSSISNARRYLGFALEAYRSSDTPEVRRDSALPLYNLGILAMKSRKNSLAQERFEETIRLCKQREPGENECLVLFVPRIEAGKLRYEERDNPNLPETAQEALRVVTQLLDDSG
jgi:hypothetical protein